MRRFLKNSSTFTRSIGIIIKKFCKNHLKTDQYGPYSMGHTVLAINRLQMIFTRFLAHTVWAFAAKPLAMT